MGLPTHTVNVPPVLIYNGPVISYQTPCDHLLLHIDIESCFGYKVTLLAMLAEHVFKTCISASRRLPLICVYCAVLSPGPGVIYSELLFHSTSVMLRAPSSNSQRDNAGCSVIWQVAYAFNVFAELQKRVYCVINGHGLIR